MYLKNDDTLDHYLLQAASEDGLYRLYGRRAYGNDFLDLCLKARGLRLSLNALNVRVGNPYLVEQAAAVGVYDASALQDMEQGGKIAADLTAP